MAQVLEFRLPDLGEGLTEAEIVRWLVEVGDVVAVDQPVVEVETAKAMVDVPCPYAGVVTARFGEEGSELPVGAPLITVAVGAAAPGGSTEASGGSAGARETYLSGTAPPRHPRGGGGYARHPPHPRPRTAGASPPSRLRSRTTGPGHRRREGRTSPVRPWWTGPFP